MFKSVRLKHHLHSALSCERLYARGEQIVDALSSPDVAAYAPKGCADEQTYILREFQERALEVELVDHGGEYEARDNLRAGVFEFERSATRCGTMGLTGQRLSLEPDFRLSFKNKCIYITSATLTRTSQSRRR